MENLLFYGAKLKIKRADQHIKELVRILHVFSQAGFHRIGIEEDSQTTGSALKFEMTDDTLEDIPLIIGDAIHNLRVALDHLMCELVTRAGKTPTKHTRFAFWKTRKEAVTGLEGVIQGVSLDVLTSILEYVQPYGGGNDALWTLHALDIADKHRLLVSILTTVGMKVGTKSQDRLVSYLVFPIVRGEKTRVIRPPSSAKIEVYDNPMLHILFDDVEGLQDPSVIPALHQLRQAVYVTVQEVEKAVLASRQWFSL